MIAYGSITLGIHREPPDHSLFGGATRPVFIPVAVDARDAASSERWVEEVKRADAIELAGGDQSRHTRSLLEADGADSPLAGALRSFSAGHVIMGSSAGTATQGVLQYGEGDVYRCLTENRLEEDAGDRPLRKKEVSAPSLSLEVSGTSLATSSPHETARSEKTTKEKSR